MKLKIPHYLPAKAVTQWLDDIIRIGDASEWRETKPITELDLSNVQLTDKMWSDVCTALLSSFSAATIETIKLDSNLLTDNNFMNIINLVPIIFINIISK